MARRLIAFPCFFAAASAVVNVWAADAGLPDPTRPAIEVNALVGANGTNGAAPASDPGLPPGPRLQSILRPAQGAPRALVDGRWVTAGGRAGEARLVQIGDDFVVLAGSAGRQVLRLTPKAQKRPARDVALRARHGENSK